MFKMIKYLDDVCFRLNEQKKLNDALYLSNVDRTS